MKVFTIVALHWSWINADLVDSRSMLSSFIFQNNIIQGVDNHVKKNDNDSNHQQSLPESIQNDINSLLQYSKAISNELKNEKVHKHLSKLSPELIVFLEEASRESLHNATKFKDELVLALSEESNYDVLFLKKTPKDKTILEDSTPDEQYAANPSLKDKLHLDMQELEEVINKIKRAEQEGKNMVDKAIMELNSYKAQASDDAKYRVNIVKNDFLFLAEAMVSEARSKKQQSIKDLKDTNSKQRHTRDMKKLLDIEIWKQAGFVYSTSVKDELIHDKIDAIDAIKALPLKRFRIANDTKQNVLVTKGSFNDEGRSRTHIGVIDEKVLSKHIDSKLHSGKEANNAIIHYLNLKALSDIADDIDRIKSQLHVLKSLTSEKSALSLSIYDMKSDVASRVLNETIGDLAAKVALLEAESVSKNVSLQLQNIKQSLRIHQEHVRLEKYSTIMDANLQSIIQEVKKRATMQSLQDTRSSKRHQVLSSAIESLKTVSRLMESVNGTMREMKLNEDKANKELYTQIAQIKADASEERTQENESLQRIYLLGEESRKAMIQMIEVVFGHIVGGLYYLLANEEGRLQMLMVITSMTALVFSVSILKELISLTSHYIISAISMPRLVRQWGKAGCYKKGSEYSLSTIILGREEKQRVHSICEKIKIGRRRRKAPLQNILIYGKTGTGKSMIAKAIAQESGLPFAIMSGADIAPLNHLGPTELNKVLSWAQSQRNGGIVVIDEAESALGRRIRQKSKSNLIEIGAENASGSSRDALNVFLSMTGDAYNKIMIILTTSNPSELDDAVLDRCDEMLHCPLPQAIERADILENEFRKVFIREYNYGEYRSQLNFHKEDKQQSLYFDKAFNVEAQIHAIAKDDMTSGCSGRELVKIIRALQNEMYLRNEILCSKIWIKEVKRICNMMRCKKHLNK